MTARRRRKSGSGPSATALIAWVGARQTAIGAPMSAPVSVVHGGDTPGMPRNRAILVGRACGVAAGTLLACGSVLVSATQPGEGPLHGNNAPSPYRTPVALGDSNPDGYRADVSTERPPAAPELVSTQTVAESSQPIHPGLGEVRRNNPDSVVAPAAPSQPSSSDQQSWVSPPPAAGHAPSSPIAPVAPVLDPATKRVGRVAPVGGVLAPTTPSGEQTGSSRDEPAANPRAEQSGHTTSGAGSSGAGSSGAGASVRQVAGPVSNAVEPAVQPVVQQPAQPSVQQLVQPVVQPSRPAMAMLTSVLPKG